MAHSSSIVAQTKAARIARHRARPSAGTPFARIRPPTMTVIVSAKAGTQLQRAR